MLKVGGTSNHMRKKYSGILVHRENEYLFQGNNIRGIEYPLALALSLLGDIFIQDPDSSLDTLSECLFLQLGIDHKNPCVQYAMA